jgi:hypothetical protein
MSVLVMVATAVAAVDIHDCLYFCICDGGGGGGGVGCKYTLYLLDCWYVCIGDYGGDGGYT